MQYNKIQYNNRMRPWRGLGRTEPFDTHWASHPSKSVGMFSRILYVAVWFLSTKAQNQWTLHLPNILQVIEMLCGCGVDSFPGDSESDSEPPVSGVDSNSDSGIDSGLIWVKDIASNTKL